MQNDDLFCFRVQSFRGNIFVEFPTANSDKKVTVPENHHHKGYNHRVTKITLGAEHEHKAKVNTIEQVLNAVLSSGNCSTLKFSIISSKF